VLGQWCRRRLPGKSHEKNGYMYSKGVDRSGALPDKVTIGRERGGSDGKRWKNRVI
jgi:hypothetical protein